MFLYKNELPLHYNTFQYQTKILCPIQSNPILNYLILCVMVMVATCKKPNNELLPKETEVKKETPTIITQNSNENITFRNGRLVFKDEATFDKAMKSLFSIQAETFENQFSGYTSWRKHNILLAPTEGKDINKNKEKSNQQYPQVLYYDTNQPNLPTFLTTLINNKREYQIGNTIIYLEEGNVHLIPEEKEASLKVEGWFDAKLLGEMKKGNLKVVNFNESNGTERSGSWADAKYQYQYNSIGHTFKQVFEVSAIRNDYGNKQTTIIYVKQKLVYWYKRWWTSGSWEDAGDYRNVGIINLQSYVEYPADPLSPTTSSGTSKNINSINNNLTNINYQREILLHSYDTSDMRAEAEYWRFNLTADQMYMYVPSHNQTMNLSNVFWQKFY